VAGERAAGRRSVAELGGSLVVAGRRASTGSSPHAPPHARPRARTPAPAPLAGDGFNVLGNGGLTSRSAGEDGTSPAQPDKRSRTGWSPTRPPYPMLRTTRTDSRPIAASP